MIDEGLISYKHYYRWADDIIEFLEISPGWIIDLAVTKYRSDAVEIVNRFAFSEPFESVSGSDLSDERVACVFLRHERGELSWATFLESAGKLTDGMGNGLHDCSYFYEMLKVITDGEYNSWLAANQRKRVERDFWRALATIRSVYEEFCSYFRRFESWQIRIVTR